VHSSVLGYVHLPTHKPIPSVQAFYLFLRIQASWVSISPMEIKGTTLGWRLNCKRLDLCWPQWVQFGSQEHHRTSWNSMESHGTSWNSTEPHGMSQVKPTTGSPPRPWAVGGAVTGHGRIDCMPVDIYSLWDPCLLLKDSSQFNTLLISPIPILCASHGISRKLMESHGTSWNPMEGSGTWQNLLVADK
jgi:hypothetical protein